MMKNRIVQIPDTELYGIYSLNVDDFIEYGITKEKVVDSFTKVELFEGPKTMSHDSAMEDILTVHGQNRIEQLRDILRDIVIKQNSFHGSSMTLKGFRDDDYPDGLSLYNDNNTKVGILNMSGKDFVADVEYEVSIVEVEQK